ncbi:MAG: multiprotein-bridging factor 1 family protein [Candidatus Aenigmatarchaeota archaeon]|nr:TIGR00270 family protein [Candidatus Aenigmarchaeota archaeon]
MVECEICGKKASKKAEIEGAILNVCESCVKFGKEIVTPNVLIRKPNIKPSKIEEIIIRDDLNILVKKHREKLGLTQQQFAEKIFEKVGVIKRIEEGWIPPIEIVRKLEREMKMKLTEN